MSVIRDMIQKYKFKKEIESILFEDVTDVFHDVCINDVYGIDVRNHDTYEKLIHTDYKIKPKKRYCLININKLLKEHPQIDQRCLPSRSTNVQKLSLNIFKHMVAAINDGEIEKFALFYNDAAWEFDWNGLSYSDIEQITYPATYFIKMKDDDVGCNMVSWKGIDIPNTDFRLHYHYVDERLYDINTIFII